MPSPNIKAHAPRPGAHAKPSPVQRRWLRSGLAQPGGKLPLFDADGQRISTRTVRRCLELGWAEPWFANPLKPDWIVCKLTHLGRVVAEEDDWASDRRRRDAAGP